GIANNGGAASDLPINAPIGAGGKGAGAGGAGGEGAGAGGAGAGGAGAGAGGAGAGGGAAGAGGGGAGAGGAGGGGAGAGGAGGGGAGAGGGGAGAGGGGAAADGAGGGAGGGSGGVEKRDIFQLRQNYRTLAAGGCAGGDKSGPWDGPTDTGDGAGCGVSWSDACVGMYVAVLQGAIYETVVASPFVEAVAVDDDGEIAGGPFPGAKAATYIQQQANAPWNIARLSSNKTISKPSTYSFNSTAGQGVDIYILDTGVLVSHVQFTGRAKVGGNIGLGTADGNGHGTFCASVAAGNTYGVAKQANIISIKTFTDAGGGAASNVVKGVALVLDRVKKSKRPSIISLSASFPANAAIDAIVEKASKTGIHWVSAAGNFGADASAYSPARSPYSVTVGAIDSADAVAKYSNYGPVVSLFAGGTNVIGAFIGTSASSVMLSGTSMATPSVAGLIAYFISVWGNAAPLVMADALTKAATPNSIKGLKGGSVNLVAGNCRAMNDTCFDWSKPGKYLPIPPPPPPPNNVTSSAAPPPPTSAEKVAYRVLIMNPKR
ncbi:hypothetical protein JCM11641_005432, partial [Rhodosporidiobolus odoratus]